MNTELPRFSKSMDGYMEPDEDGQWVRLEYALDAIEAALAKQAQEPSAHGIISQLVSAAVIAHEAMEKHRQVKGEPPTGLLGTNAMEQLKAAIKAAADFCYLLETDTTLPAPQPAVPVVEAFAEGWRMAADWANRDDLLPDMDSPQYAKERDERLAELRPAVEPMAHPTGDLPCGESSSDPSMAKCIGMGLDVCEGCTHGFTGQAEGGA